MNYPIQLGTRLTAHGTFSSIMLPDGVIETILLDASNHQVDAERNTAYAVVERQIQTIIDRQGR